MCSTPKASHSSSSRTRSSDMKSTFAGAGAIYRELEAAGKLRGCEAPDQPQQSACKELEEKLDSV